MGFYSRSSLRAGPFRFNLSRSGIGVSAGVPGFRVGTGPRGNYVRLGRPGTYYATTRVTRSHRGTMRAPQTPAIPSVPATGQVALTELDGAAVHQLEASNPTELVTQLHQAARRVRWWPSAATVLGLLALVTMPVGLILLVLGVPGVLWLRLRDKSRRSVVVFYDVNDEAADRFDRLAGAHAALCQVRRAWRVETQGALVTTYQRKVNAGASGLIRRTGAVLTAQGPPVLVTNIAVPGLVSGKRAVYFLPDRILVRQGRDYADVPYSSLQVHAAPQNFIEDGPVPADAAQVGTTWRYANVKGGPDRRYKNNRQLPIMRYGRLTLTNPAGLLTVFDFSRPDAMDAFVTSLRGMAA